MRKGLTAIGIKMPPTISTAHINQYLSLFISDHCRRHFIPDNNSEKERIVATPCIPTREHGNEVSTES